MKSSGLVGGGGDVALETHWGAVTKRTVDVVDGGSGSDGGGWFIKFAQETPPIPSSLIKFTSETTSDITFNIYF